MSIVVNFPLHVEEGDWDVDVELSEEQYKRLRKIVLEVEREETDEDIRFFPEIKDIFDLVSECAIEAFTESFLENPDSAYGEIFGEEGIDGEDYDAVSEYVRDNIDFAIDWPDID